MAKTLQQYSEMIDEVLNHINDIQNDFEKNLAMEIEEDLDRIFSTSIRKWYHSYRPRFYKRRYSLLKSYKITFRNHIVRYDFDSSFINTYFHRITYQYGQDGQDYWFDLTFNRGYHGGADSIRKSKESMWGVHPNPGTPWYRTPPPIIAKNKITPYGFWSRRKAFKSESPKEIITEQLHKYESGQKTIIDKTMSEKVIYDNLKLALFKYDLFN